MSACMDFPEQFTDDSVLLGANLILTALAVTIGVLTNLLNAFVLNSADIRKSNPAFTYLALLAIADGVYLLGVIPEYIRNTQILDAPEVTYSAWMTNTVHACAVLRSILLHVALWCIALAAVVFLIRVHKALSYKPGWTKISISRFIAFPLCVALGILNLPQLFEYRVERVPQHCFETLDLWQLARTAFSSTDWYRALYQWLTMFVGVAAPLVVMFVTCAILPFRVGLRAFFSNMRCLPTVHNDWQREAQLAKCVFALLTVNLILVIPYAYLKCYELLIPIQNTKDNGSGDLQLICNMLLLFRAGFSGTIYFLAYGDYHKCLCRSLCCSADEYYEPCACVYTSCCRKTDPIDTGVLERKRAEENDVLLRKAHKNKGVFGSKTKRKSNELSRWV